LSGDVEAYSNLTESMNSWAVANQLTSAVGELVMKIT
jgi:hypothetical protein